MAAERRLKQLGRLLSPPPPQTKQLLHTGTHKLSGSSVEIDGIKLTVDAPSNPELVPKLYLNKSPSQTVLHHLKWMISKDLIGQDMYLLSPPGPYPRHLALSFGELVSREVEFVSLSRDSTEVDMKQRKEIINGSVTYEDQAVVRAAINGRLLILEGIEKAERNVLPVLNNLLENREAQLDDGRFIVSHERYDQLAAEHSTDDLNLWKLLRASEKFRVIAIGLPVPPYHGNTLDPPLRSRFQARHILPLPFPEALEECKQTYPSISEQNLSSVLSIVYTMLSMTQSNSGGPINLTGQLDRLLTILSNDPSIGLTQLIQSVYPSRLLSSGQLLEGILEKFGPSFITSSVVSAPIEQAPPVERGGYVPLPSHSSCLNFMTQCQSVGDLCIVGEKGSGKTMLINQLAKALGYSIEPIVLYQDMSSRDLLQQRITTSNGDTGWRMSPLITAAVNGSMAVLDGLHRLDSSTASTLKRLVQDREVDLTDGTRLLRHDRFIEAMSVSGLTEQEMRERKIFPVHPKFSIVAVGEATPTQPNDWLTPELLSMFQFVNVFQLPKEEEKELIQIKVPTLSSNVIDKLLNFTHFLRRSDDPTLVALSSSLSTRQLLRIAHHLAHYSNGKEGDLFGLILKASLSRFLPPVAKSALFRALSSNDIHPSPSPVSDNDNMQYSRADGFLRIGSTKVPIHAPTSDIAMVPDVTFYDNPLHVRIMEDMLKDYSLGEHLLLIGNQGVGKNKLADRFLHLMNSPREYLQLHRDSTVQTLTTQPSVIDGRITYQDSPLVRAVEYGRVLVVDEADKAPTHVTAILRNIVNGESITLSDGRKIMPTGSSVQVCDDTIPIHSDFRMIVLANRPGFPFLGNDFYAAVGDCFSVHAVDNPDFESEMSMVSQYGPDVPQKILQKLVSAFSDLREMADEGRISYPYSTREVVNIVKHMQMFPNEGVSTIVRNVFDFDSYSSHLLDTVISTLHKHGIPLGANRKNVRLATKDPLPALALTNTFNIDTSNHQKLNYQQTKIKLTGGQKLPLQSIPCERDVIRSRLFSEIKSQWVIPLHESDDISSICTSADNKSGHNLLHVITHVLPSIYTLNINNDTLSYIDLFNYLPSGRGSGHPLISLTALDPVDNGPHGGKILIHEGFTGILYLLDSSNANLSKVVLPTSNVSGRFLGSWRGKKKDDISLLSKCPNGNSVIIYQRGSNVVSHLDFSSTSPLCSSLSLPVSIHSLLPIVTNTGNKWLLIDTNKRIHFLHNSSPQVTLPDSISPLINGPTNEDELLSLSSAPLPQLMSSFISLNESVYLASTESSPLSCLTLNPQDSTVKLFQVTQFGPSSQYDDITHLSKDGSIVTAATTKTGSNSKNVTQYLSVFDIPNSTHWKIELPEWSNSSLYSLPRSVSNVLTVSVPNDSAILAVNERGTVSLIETNHFSLQRSLDEWYSMVGNSTDDRQLFISRESGLDVSLPKHGKVDPNNAPHVGGNTWAGGTGGRDTAGLGGKGGPYRLDAGHNVYQLSDEEKMAVPEEVKQAARELGQKALKERLKEISMSEHDHNAFTQLRARIHKQVGMLKAILESTQSKSNERQWLRHQTDGDLDDRKLVDGLTGEKAVYKRRGEKEPEFGHSSNFRKSIRLVVDVSGSMYRFNGYDGRLDRTLEAVLMVIEAFESYSMKFKLDIVGHSGDSAEIPFLSSESPPMNEKEKMDILKSMHAHSQFCWSGDNTLKATATAISTIRSDSLPSQESYIIILSDANFSRYRISPVEYGRLILSDPHVNVFAVFIGSLDDEATRLQDSLPAGRSFVCMNNSDLPIIIRQVLSSSVI